MVVFELVQSKKPIRVHRNAWVDIGGRAGREGESPCKCPRCLPLLGVVLSLAALCQQHVQSNFYLQLSALEDIQEIHFQVYEYITFCILL